MRGFIVKRVRHVCVGGRRRWVQMPQGSVESSVPPCPLCGADVAKGDGKKDGVKYDAMYRAGGKQKSQVFDTKREAEGFLTTTVKEVQTGNYVHVRPIPMEELFKKYLEDHLQVRRKQGDVKPSTVKSYTSMVKVHLNPAFTGYRSDRLTPDVLAQWERKLADKIESGEMSRKSFNHLVALLHVILAWARAPSQRYLVHDPLIDVRRLRVPKIERRFLQPHEIDALLCATEPPVDTVLYLAVYSGLRRGELFGLQWGDLDEHANTLRIVRNNYQCEIVEPKTQHSRRTVDIPAAIVKRLLDYRKAYPPIPSKKGDFIFRNESGTPIDPDNWFTTVFVPTAVRAQLRSATANEDRSEQQVGLHTLRHTYASLLINQGASIKYVSKQLGHASSQITLDLYGHLFKETGDSEMKKLSMRISGAVKGGNVVEMATGTTG